MNQLANISDILNDAVFDTANYKNSIKKAVAFSFWKNAAGAKFAGFSLPYDIKGKTLMVAVKNPQVMQELLFYKAELTAKLKDYFLPLDILIEDIRFDYKVWNRYTSKNILEGADNPDYYEEDDINSVVLNRFERDEISKVTDSISKLTFLDDKLKEKYEKNIINSLKVKKLRNGEGAKGSV